MDPKDPESFSSRVPKEPLALMQDPFAAISNQRKCKVHWETFEAFKGGPRGDNPNHIILGAAGLAMAKRVLHPPEAKRWPSAEANAFMNKYPTLIPEHRQQLESDLYMEPFLKEHERNPSFKQAFDFKTKMFGSLKSHRTSLVPLFKLLDRLVEVKQQVDDTLDMSKAVVAPVGLPDVGPNPGEGEDNVPAMFRPLLSSPKVVWE